MSIMKSKKYFLDIEPHEFKETVVKWGIPSYKSEQILKWAYQKQIKDFNECSDLSLDLRTKLLNEYQLRSLKLASKEISRADGTIRYNFSTEDSNKIIAVFLPERGRNTVCISSQIGCPAKCNFCATGKIDFVRNLSRGELLEQILQISNDAGVRISNVLFMGMGEPLLNYKNLVSALQAIVDPKYFGLSRRHVTISTIGIVPNIKKLFSEKTGVRLALSLHAPNDEIRKKLVNNRQVPYTVRDIVKTAAEYAVRKNTRLTIEYILIKNMNDSREACIALIECIKGLIPKKIDLRINLIPYNNIDTKLKFETPSKEACSKFRDYLNKEYLNKHNLMAIIRSPRGIDIKAGCGQLY